MTDTVSVAVVGFDAASPFPGPSVGDSRIGGLGGISETIPLIEPAVELAVL